MEWFPLIIPILACVVGFTFFKEKFTIWEYAIPPAAVVLTILISKAAVKTTIVNDDEYWGSIVVEARYYESWETWITKTCSYTTTCCCDKNGANCQTIVHYYDCSYCDENSPAWVAYDNAGNSWTIDQSYYNFLMKKWNATPEFVELNRRIDYRGSCGDDGDMYRIRWDNQISTSESAVTIHQYTNKVQVSHNSFKLPHITRKEAKSLGLYDYPSYYDYYKQKVVLGLDSIAARNEVVITETKFQYFNGFYGSRNKVKLFICLFYDKPISIARKQQAYWDGGNQNELVVCIGLDKARNIKWVSPFSWTDRKRILVDCREDIANLGRYHPDSVYNAVENAVKGHLSVYKDFKKDFSYLSVELPKWALKMIWILAIIVTAGTWFFCYANEIDNEVIEKMNQNIKPEHRSVPILDRHNRPPIKKKFKRRF